MSTKWAGDPVQVAHDIWADNGWRETAGGMAAVTSIGRVNQLINQRADQILTPLELSFARYEVLVVLYFNPDPVSLSFIAGALQLHQATVTGLVDKLEKQGLLVRQPHPDDRRSTLARLTRQGRSRARTAIKRMNTGLFSELGLDVEQVQTLVALLATIRREWGDLTEQAEEVDDDGGADLPVAQPAP